MVDVSVITPAWNAGKTITRAMTSALSQTGVSVEVIVADDASTDDTGQIMIGFRDERVRYLRLPVNGGPAAARNAAIDVAQGRWIAVLDADDLLLPDRLAKLVAVAVDRRLEIATDNMLIEDAQGHRRLFIQEALDGSIHTMSLANYVTNNRLFTDQPGEGYLKPIFAADFLRHHQLRYDTGTRIGEDFLLVAEAMALGGRYGRVSIAGYIYTTSAGSISHRLTRSNADAMVEADRRFLTRHGARLNATERAAWMAHQRSLEDGASFVGMIDSIKNRDFGGLARSVWQHPAAIRHFSMPIRARLERLTRRRPVETTAA
jgi:succinoglycan biosynthesis protein ExoO